MKRMNMQVKFNVPMKKTDEYRAIRELIKHMGTAQHFLGCLVSSAASPRLRIREVSIEVDTVWPFKQCQACGQWPKPTRLLAVTGKECWNVTCGCGNLNYYGTYMQVSRKWRKDMKARFEIARLQD
jgi:hypothetical protein